MGPRERLGALGADDVRVGQAMSLAMIDGPAGCFDSADSFRIVAQMRRRLRRTGRRTRAGLRDRLRLSRW
jgi:hypothetical protein